ncbi:hypothetical protein GGR54DRAFT_642063 [Hypoxylon sp. NC1633]|nr:hypothetical protein GGR54DRAFT_642063 [Hypoxylon sp. NC1633]
MSSNTRQMSPSSPPESPSAASTVSQASDMTEPGSSTITKRDTKHTTTKSDAKRTTTKSDVKQTTTKGDAEQTNTESNAEQEDLKRPFTSEEMDEVFRKCYAKTANLSHEELVAINPWLEPRAEPCSADEVDWDLLR